MAMTLEDQQKTLADHINRSLSELLADFPSINPRVASISLIDFAVQLAALQGATEEQVTARVKIAWAALPSKFRTSK